MSERPSTFAKYFKTAMTSVKLSTSDKEIGEIRNSTKDLISKIWGKALTKNKMFELSEVIAIGSMEEGSRLFSADEFDFMMILRMKDFPIDKIVLKEGCRPGFVRLFLEDPTVRLNQCFQENRLHSWEFRKHVLSQLQTADYLSDKSGNLGLIKRELGGMGLTEKGKQGILRLFGKHEIDAWNFLFEWHKQKISVDTMPAIAITKEQIEDFEKAHRISLFHDRKHKDCAFAGNEKCYLIPKGCQKDDNEEGCGCWLIDFAPTEVTILQSMNKTHKDCQKFLKYIFRYYHKLPSYMIKASVLKHLENCTGSSSEQNCTLDILKYISKCLDGANLPDPFLSKRNIFGWKEVDLFRTLSPTKTAIIFENHSRFVGLLLQIIQKMTQVNITVYNNSGTSPRPFSDSELSIIEQSMPLCPTNDDVDINDFMDEIEPELKEFISQKKWTTITELRDLTRPYLKDLRWGPIEYFKDTQRKVAQQEQNLNVLL